jgi:hypothetical protein
MIDLLAALIEYLKSDSDIMGLVNDRVYGEKLPRGEIENMPRHNIVIVSAGGIETTKTDPIFTPRYDIWCYGDSLYNAAVLDRIVYAVVKNIQREFINSVLIHSAGLSGGPLPYVDGDTGYCAMIRAITVKADERKII